MLKSIYLSRALSCYLCISVRVIAVSYSRLEKVERDKIKKSTEKGLI